MLDTTTFQGHPDVLGGVVGATVEGRSRWAGMVSTLTPREGASPGHAVQGPRAPVLKASICPLIRPHVPAGGSGFNGGQPGLTVGADFTDTSSLGIVCRNTAVQWKHIFQVGKFQTQVY